MKREARTDGCFEIETRDSVEFRNICEMFDWLFIRLCYRDLIAN